MGELNPPHPFRSMLLRVFSRDQAMADSTWRYWMLATLLFGCTTSNLCPLAADEPAEATEAEKYLKENPAIAAIKAVSLGHSFYTQQKVIHVSPHQRSCYLHP